MGKKIFLEKLKKFDIWIISALLLIIFSYLFFVVYNKYFGFDFSSGDTAVAEQAIWNAANGNGFYQSFLEVDTNFREHLNFSQFLFVPLYYLFPHTLTLYVVIYLFFFSATIYLYNFIKNRLSVVMAIIGCFLFIFHPMTLLQLTGPMHVAAIAGPLFLITLIQYYKNNYKKWILFLILTMLVSEFVIPTIMLFGVLAFLEKRKIKWIIPPVFMGMTLYFVASQYITIGYSKHFNLIQKISSLSLMSEKRIFFALDFIKPILYFPVIFSLYSIFLIPSLLLILFISERSDTAGHLFSLVPAVVVMIFIDISIRFGNKYKKTLIVIALLGIVMILSMSKDHFEFKESMTLKEMQEAIALVKDEGSVTSSRQMSYHLNRRNEFYLNDNEKLTDYVVLKKGKKSKGKFNEYEDKIIKSNEYIFLYRGERIRVYIKKEKIAELLGEDINNIPSDIDDIKNRIIELDEQP